MYRGAIEDYTKIREVPAPIIAEIQEALNKWMASEGFREVSLEIVEWRLDKILRGKLTADRAAQGEIIV